MSHLERRVSNIERQQKENKVEFWEETLRAMSDEELELFNAELTEKTGIDLSEVRR